MMTSSQQDPMPPPSPKSKKDNIKEEIVDDDEVPVLVLEEVEEGQIMLRDPKTGEVEEGEIVLRDPKSGEPILPEESTTLEEKDGSDVKKEDIVDDDEDNEKEDTTKDEKTDGSDVKKEDIVDDEDNDKDTTKDEKIGTISVEFDPAIPENNGKDGEKEDESVTKTSTSNVASGRPSRRSKIDAKQKMTAALKKEESDDDDDDDDEDKIMMDHDDEAEQKVSDKDDNEEEEKDDAVVKKESEGINGDDNMAEDDDKSTKRKSNNKKRKKTKAKDSVKTENDDIKEEEEEDREPVEEKPKKRRVRVSESIVKDAAEKMFAELVKNYKDGITETPIDILASSITTKAGKSYRNHRSDAIQEGMKLLKAEGKAEKDGGVARLLQSEIDKIPKEKISKDPEQVVKQRKAQFLLSLEHHPKGGSGEKVTEAATAVWNKLLDGEAYTRKELVADTTYKGSNSTGFEGIMKVLTQLQFVEGKGKCSFSDKIFPHGRPNKVTK